ncbi:LEAF RUST 10 DISEASE-RESISTANCE LOCUS RECEPTOR-LIKE PROTEIN KINASE-like 2.4 [Cynara cardunculus var. scolymus]|nr:LEAF RUST 10 DISEASE-RESISTANCE LOCUS RECEPTOR-LIKE PROTEIN KINASE-like 2.4 [Cynara cardunculus var. scolymus]
MNSRYLIVKLLIFITIEECSSALDGFNGTCDDSFSCGTISGIGYPFRRHQDPTHCGYPGFELNCDERNLPTIDIMNLKYQILGIDLTAQILRVVREDMVNSICPQELVNTTINHELFDYTSSYMNISFLFGCPFSSNIVGFGSILCSTDEISSPVLVLPGIQGPGDCKTSVVTPVPVGFLDPTRLGQVLREGFEVRWKVGRTCSGCMRSGGRCLYNNDTGLTMCGCPGPTFLADNCSTTNKTEVGSSPSSGMQLFSTSFLLVGVGSWRG